MTTPPGTPNRWLTPSPCTSNFVDKTPALTLSTPLSPLPRIEFSPDKKPSVNKNFENPSTGKTHQFAQKSGRFPKAASKENSPPQFNFADLCPDEDAFSETASSSKNVRHKMPSTPEHHKHKSHVSASLTEQEQNNQDRFITSEAMWNSLAKYPEIGEGNFHKALLDAVNRIVYKVPNAKYREQSRHMKHKEPICFVHVSNAHQNYCALQGTKLPGLLKLAKTEFNLKNAIITQEVWDRPFDPEQDLKNGHVRETVRAMLQLLAGGTMNIDFRPANLGWKNGELKLFDFLEERDNKSIHTISEFTRQFATETEQRGNEIITKINKPLYHFLLPKTNVLLNYS